MKILFVTNTFENVLNGPSKFANYLLDMNEIFDHVEIKILTEDVSTNSKLIDSGHIFRLDLKLNFWTRSWGFAYRMFPYYRACVHIHRSFEFDIVVFNNAITGIWSAFKLNIPVLGMINDDNSLCISRKNFQKTTTWFRHLIFHYLEKLACQFEAGIIVNSKYLHDLARKKYNSENIKLHILYKGVEVSNTVNFRSVNSDLPIKILFVKSDYIRGGLFDLVEALGLLTKYKFELQIIGPPHSHKKQILEANRFLNLNIIFSGPRNPIEVQNSIQVSDLLIVPSRKEALGVANLEAISNGLTVISTNAGGIPEVLNFGKNGWMTEPGSPKKLAEIISYVIQHPEEQMQKQKDGFAFVTTHFSQTSVLNNFLEILDHYKS